MNEQKIPNDVIFKSRIMAKATGKDKQGNIVIVCVFEMSQEYRFFFLFNAKSTRSPRKSWVYRGQYWILHEARVHMPNNDKGRLSFRHFLAGLGNYSGWTVRYPYRKQKLIDLFARVGNWVAHLLPGHMRLAPGATFEYANSITSGREKTIRSRREYAREFRKVPS